MQKKAVACVAAVVAAASLVACELLFPASDLDQSYGASIDAAPDARGEGAADAAASDGTTLDGDAPDRGLRDHEAEAPAEAATSDIKDAGCECGTDYFCRDGLCAHCSSKDGSSCNAAEPGECCLPFECKDMKCVPH